MSCLGVFVGALVLVSIAVISYSIYYDTLTSYYNILKTEEYSYLVIALILVAYILYSALHTATIEYEIKVNKILLFITLIVFSVTLYIISFLNPLYRLSIQILSYILLVYSFLILIYKPSKYRYKLYLLLVTALFLVPVPRSLLDQASVELSRVVGYLASRIAGLPYIIRSGRVFIRVVDAQGYMRVFEIGYLCSGIVSISSMLALLPLITYFVLGSKLSIKKKILYITLFTLTGVSIVFIGNLLRVLAILLITKYHSYRVALDFFHSTPALIYTGIATATVMYLIYRSIIKKNLYSVYRPVAVKIPPLNIEIVRNVSVYIVLILIGLTLTLSLVNTSPNQKLGGREEIAYLDVSEVIENPFKLLVRNETLYKNIWYRPYELRIATPISSIKIYYLRISCRGSTYLGYLEIADSPNKFHSWIVCLTYQGYNIESYWIAQHDDSSIFFIIAERHGYRYIMGYTIYKMRVLVGGSLEPIYIRVTLFHPYISSRFDDIVDGLEDVLVEMKPLETSESSSMGNYMFYIYVVQTIVFIDIVYITVYIVRHSIRNLKSISESLGGR